MEEYYVVVGDEGEIEIPTEIRESMGMLGETPIAIEVDGGRIIVTPNPEK